MKSFNKILPGLFVLAIILSFSKDSVANITKAPPIHNIHSAIILAQADGRAQDPVVLRQNAVQVIELDQDMGSIVLTDPRPLEMIVENTRRAVLHPKQPGVTNLTIISDSGDVLYKKDILVSNRGENFVRVKRMCNDANCQDEDIYYCPYGCYGVRSLQDSANTNQGDTAVSAQPE